jgi:hypothetical protein
MNEGSYVELPSEKVREMAEACIENVHRTRREETDNDVAHYRQKYERRAKTWWGKLFQLSVPSDESIESSLVAGSFLVYNISGWGSLRAAEDLLLASKLGPTVLVSTEDLRLVKGRA